MLAPLTFEFSKLRANHSTLPVELPILFVDEVGRASASSPEPLLVGSPRRVADSLLGSRVGADAANANDDLEMTASGGVGSVTVHVVGVRYKWVF